MALIFKTGTVPPSRAGAFTATHWSIVLAAAGTDSPAARDALARLCRDYWQPLYTYVRRRGCDAHEAEDLTQDFFARLLEKDWLKQVQPEKGRFRSFLLAALNHFLSNEWDKQRRLKRGGGVTLVSLDETRDEERRLHAEPADGLTPERAFERRWALTLLERALKALEADWTAKGRAAEFAALQGFLSAMPEGDAYARAAAQLSATEGAVRVAVHRLRKRMGEHLRREIAQTVTSAAEVEAELRELFAALAT